MVFSWCCIHVTQKDTHTHTLISHNISSYLIMILDEVFHVFVLQSFAVFKAGGRCEVWTREGGIQAKGGI